MLDDRALILNLDKYLNSPHIVYIKNPQGIIIECNQHQAEDLGLISPDEVIGKSDFDLVCEEEAIAIRKNEQRILSTEEPQVIIELATHILKDKPAYPYYLSHKIPVKNSTGKIIGIIGTSIILDPIKNNLSLDMLISHRDLQSASPNNKTIRNFAEKIKNKFFSKREQQCLDFLIQGKSAKRIAQELKLSPRTVEHYIENMKNKLACQNTNELIAKALCL